MITYAADAHDLYGELYFTEPATHPPGAKREVRDWDSLEVLGHIDQPAKTYRTVGNMNEHQVAIAETTFGGHKELRDPKGAIDYGSMIYIALERAKSAREAIQIMTSLANEHGYHSKGESFSVADPNEVWLFELIGKGPENKGVVWVACQVPDGYVTVHANQPRIRTFVQNDPNQCIYAPDVISFAREKGYFKGADSEFSFADAYATQNCDDLRTTDARVWSFYHRVAPSQKIPPDVPLCKPNAKPLPLWIKPDRKLSVRDLMSAMRDHFEDTPFDMRNDVGAGPFALPYRWRPLRWEYDGKTYGHQRATATQQTGFSFISQSRSWMPSAVGGLVWFSVDDTASTVYVPMYASMTSVPKPYAVGTATFDKFSWDSAFWVFNWISNFAYSRYSDMIVDIRKAQGELEQHLLQNQTLVEEKAVKLHAESPPKAAAFLTKYSHDAADKVIQRWKQLGPELLMKYMDGNVRDETGKATHPPYPAAWYGRIVDEAGPSLMVADKPLENTPRVGPASSAKQGGAMLPVTSAAVPSASAFQTAPTHATADTPCPCSRSTSCAGCFAYPRRTSARVSLFFVSAVVALFAARKRGFSR